MTDLPRGTGGDTGTPRWVKIFGIIALVVVLLVLILLFTNGLGGSGGHGPGRHGASSGLTAYVF